MKDDSNKYSYEFRHALPSIEGTKLAEIMGW